MSNSIRKRPARRFLVSVSAAAMVLAVVAPAGASPDPAPAAVSASGERWGYVWADQPSGGDYTPATEYQRNSRGRVNRIQRDDGIGDGYYRVLFRGLGTGDTGGTVNITAYGTGGRSSCGLYSSDDGPGWHQVAKVIAVEVLCQEPTLVHVDSQFDVTYSLRTQHTGRYAYVWADQPASPSYTPLAAYQFNSKGFTNTISHSGLGQYAVHLPGLEGGTNGGTVKVTPEDNRRCNVSSWGSDDDEMVVNVRCFDFDGTPANAIFTMTFANKINLLGSGKGYGYAWADEPSSASYTPSPFYAASKPGGDITITRSSPGIYSVLFAGVGTEILSHVQVTTYGNNTNQCRVQGWAPMGTGQHIGVECYDLDGNAADSRFTVQFIR